MLTLTQLRVLAAVARHGSVSAAAAELHYTQPSISHHLARMETITGAKLTQRVGRGIRLTPEGDVLARRATEIIGRLQAASAELAAHIGLRAGRVRVAAFQSALSTVVPRAADVLRRRHPQLRTMPVDAHPAEALRLLRTGSVDVALIFRYSTSAAEEAGFRLLHVADDPMYVVSTEPASGLDDFREASWIGGCDRCREELVNICRLAGFTPDVIGVSDDALAAQALVRAGMGVALLPGLALRAYRAPDIAATELPGVARRIYAVTYGDPPDPPATGAFIEALRESVAEPEHSAAVAEVTSTTL